MLRAIMRRATLLRATTRLNIMRHRSIALRRSIVRHRNRSTGSSISSRKVKGTIQIHIRVSTRETTASGIRIRMATEQTSSGKLIRGRATATVGMAPRLPITARSAQLMEAGALRPPATCRIG